MEPAQELLDALTEHGEVLASELRTLGEMSQVKLGPGAVFDRAKPPGSNAQKRGVICRLRCCGKPLDQKCNNLAGDAACLTHVDAARMLRAKVVREHGSAACLARAEQKLAEEGSGSSGQVESAFLVMMGAQLERQRASSELMQAEESMQMLQSKLVAAEKRLEEAQVEARRLGLGAKKPRAVESEWKGREYSAWGRVEYWRQEEGRIYNARRKKLSDVAARPAEMRPRGQDGPLEHWRLGLVGALQYWSNGSKAEAAHYLTALIKHLNLQERESALNFSLPLTPADHPLPLTPAPTLPQPTLVAGADEAAPLRRRDAHRLARLVHRRPRRGGARREQGVQDGAAAPRAPQQPGARHDAGRYQTMCRLWV